MKTFLTLVFLMGTLIAGAQKFEWAIGAGTAGAETASDMATDPVTKTHYIIGTFSNTLTLGSTTLVSLGAADIFFAKLDGDGNYIWAKSLGSTAIDEGNGITYDASGNVYITGGCRALMTFTNAPAVQTITPMGTEDAFLAKYDANGNFLWVTDINDNLNAGDEAGKAVEVSNASGSIYVGIEETGMHKVYVRRYDMAAGINNNVYSADATTVTLKDMKVRRNTLASPVSDEVYVCGSFSGGLSFNFGSTIHSSTGGGVDLYVAKFSNWQGSPLRAWSFSGGGSGADVCNSIDINPASTGGFCFTGTAAASATIAGTALGNTGSDCFVGYYTETLNNSGTTKIYIKASKAGGVGQGVMMDASNNVYLTGYGLAGGFRNGTVTGMPASGISMVKFWTNGYVASRLSAAGASANSYGTRITQDAQGNAYIFGTFQSSNNFSVTTLTSAGSSDLHLSKINCTAISTPTVNTYKCVSVKDGEQVTVNFKVSKKLNSTNTFSLQIDTTSGDFISPFTAGTLASDTSGAITTYLPRGLYGYAHYRIITSSPAYTGDQSYFNILSKLVASVTPSAGLVRCSNSASSVTAFVADGSDGAFGPVYTFSPSTGITPNSMPNYYATPNVTTTYTMTADNLNGCKDTVAFTVVVNPAPTMTLISNPIDVCPGSTVALTNTVSANVTSYTWSPASTLSSSTAAVPIATPTANGLYSYTIATAQNCKFASNVSINMKPVPSVNAGPPSYTTCFGSTVPLNGTSSGITYTWSPAYGVSAVNSLTTAVTPSATTIYTLMATNVSYSCTAKDVITITVANVSVDAGISSTITCGNSKTLAATPTGTFVGPYTYEWSPTVALTSSTTQTTVANPQITQMYYVTITTANGCSATDSVKVSSTEPNYGTAFNVTPSQLITLPSPAQFNNTTPSPSNYTFYWYFGDGTSLQSNNPSVFHVYQYNGNYDVTLVAVSNTTGCADTLRIPGYVFVSGGSSCSASANVTAPNGLGGCVGDSVKLMANTGPGLTYQWMQSGVNISGATSSTYYALTSGNYAVAVNNGSCSAVSASRFVTFNNLPGTPTITPNGNLNLCAGGSLYLQTNSGYSSYSWSTGANTQNITITNSGVFTVTVTNTYGCRNSASYSANTSSMPAPDICIVGMDSLTGKHMLVWNKPMSGAIDSFIIYREGIVANQFNRLAAQSYSVFSTYLDNTSAPATQAYRYKLSLKDTCGIESLLSAYHKTIHLTINAGVGGAWNLIWNHYEGISFGTYNIYRGTALNNMALLTSIASTNNSYTDLTPPPGTVYYQIEVVNPSVCNPSARVATNYSSSRSNIVNVLPTGISGYYEMAASISVMPNPFTDELSVNIGKISSKNYTLLLTDVLGKAIIQRTDNNPTQQLNVSELSSGVYYLTIIDEHDNRYTKKMIKQ
jgi:hypothetical protein